MKSYINKLESENKGLRHKLSILKSQLESNAGEIYQFEGGEELELMYKQREIDSLRHTRLHVLENVEEITALLDGPTIFTDLKSITDRKLPPHQMKDLNLNMNSHCIPNINSNLGVPQSVDVSQHKRQNPTNTGISDVDGTCIESLSKKTNFMVKSDGNLSDPF